MRYLFNLILIYASILIGITLFVGGIYMFLKDFITPQGLMFESIVSVALGVMIFLITLVASTLGKTIMLFDEILSETTKLYDRMVNTRPVPTNFGLPNTFTIKDLKTGEETTDILSPENIDENLKRINEAVQSMVTGKTSGPTALTDMDIEELERELAKAVTGDDYEKAEEINILINNLKNPPSEKKED